MTESKEPGLLLGGINMNFNALTNDEKLSTQYPTSKNNDDERIPSRILINSDDIDNNVEKKSKERKNINKIKKMKGSKKINTTTSDSQMQTINEEDHNNTENVETNTEKKSKIKFIERNDILVYFDNEADNNIPMDKLFTIVTTTESEWALLQKLFQSQETSNNNNNSKRTQLTNEPDNSNEKKRTSARTSAISSSSPSKSSIDNQKRNLVLHITPIRYEYIPGGTTEDYSKKKAKIFKLTNSDINIFSLSADEVPVLSKSANTKKLYKNERQLAGSQHNEVPLPNKIFFPNRIVNENENSLIRLRSVTLKTITNTYDDGRPSIKMNLISFQKPFSKNTRNN